MKSITVPANEESPGFVTEFVEEQLSLYDCSPRVLNQIDIAIEEIVVNIVNYAGLADSEGIEVRCEVVDDPLRVVLQFLDGGVPFDPLTIAEPDTSPEATMEREGGLGIFMVKRMMDDVSYTYEDGKNTLTILKHFE